MHWTDVTAQSLSHKGKKHIVSTGITPSGEFHIGHLREILTGDMIARAAQDAGLDVEFVFIIQSQSMFGESKVTGGAISLISTYEPIL